jgi:hypothetical protein
MLLLYLAPQQLGANLASYIFAPPYCCRSSGAAEHCTFKLKKEGGKNNIYYIIYKKK